MSDSNADRLSERLRRLPGQLLLALVNATVVLVIVAAVLVLIATARVERLAGNVAATMTDAVLSRFDIEPRAFLTRLDRLADGVDTLTAELRTTTAQGSARLDQAAAQLETQLAALRSNIENLGAARSRLIDETIAQFARSLSENLEGLRHCPPTEGPAEATAAGRMTVARNYPD